MIQEVLPLVAAGEEMLGDQEDVFLFESEREFLATAAVARQRASATARHCARLAAQRLGVSAFPLPPGEGGAPVWPPALVGSLTHCAGYRAAAVARAEDLTALGIDAEPHAPLPAGVVELVASPAERAQLDRLAARDGSICWDRLLFSCKEAVYKAWFPLARRWLDFADCRLDLDPVRRSFHGVVRDAGEREPGTLKGRWLTRNGVILTAVAVPREVARSRAGAPG